MKNEFENKPDLTKEEVQGLSDDDLLSFLWGGGTMIIKAPQDISPEPVFAVLFPNPNGAGINGTIVSVNRPGSHKKRPTQPGARGEQLTA